MHDLIGCMILQCLEMTKKIMLDPGKIFYGGSHDGFGIREYQWIKSDSSPAIGKCIAMRSTVIFFQRRCGW